jgi:hypothetical protein
MEWHLYPTGIIKPCSQAEKTISTCAIVIAGKIRVELLSWIKLPSQRKCWNHINVMVETNSTKHVTEPNDVVSVQAELEQRWQEWVQSKPCECHPQNVPNHESSIAMSSQNYSAENLLQNPRNIPTQRCSWQEGGGINCVIQGDDLKNKELQCGHDGTIDSHLTLLSIPRTIPAWF